MNLNSASLTATKDAARFFCWTTYFLPAIASEITAAKLLFAILSALLTYPLTFSRTSLALSTITLYSINIIVIYHGLILGYDPDELFWATIARSTTDEALQFASSLGFRLTLLFPVYLLIHIIVFFVLWKSRDKTTRTTKILSVFIGIVWAIFFISATINNYDTEKYFARLKYFYPSQQIFAIRNFKHTSSDIFYKPEFRTSTGHTTPLANTIVVVIGESSTAFRWSMLHTIPEDTNSSLRRLNLNIMTVQAKGPNTATALPYLLTGQSLGNSIRSKAPSIIDIAREAGFKTFVLTNSSFYSRHEDFYSQVFRRSSDIYKKVSDGKPDEVLNTEFRRALEDPAPKKFIILHTYGSHPNVKHRYPKEFLFSNDPYNNSIAYTSANISNWIEILSTLSKDDAIFLYSSDHGVDTPPCIDGFRQGTTRSTYEVPLIFWSNSQNISRKLKSITGTPLSSSERPTRSSTLLVELTLSSIGSTPLVLGPDFEPSTNLTLGNMTDTMRKNLKVCE